ncbi:hypothetical protein [Nocardia lijiangensis]
MPALGLDAARVGAMPVRYHRGETENLSINLLLALFVAVGRFADRG